MVNKPWLTPLWLIPVLVVWFILWVGETRTLAQVAEGEPAPAASTPRPVIRPGALLQARADECLDCHDDDSFTMERDGKEVSIHVGTEPYEASPHGGLACLDCHVGFDPDEEPHKENIEPVNCASCHESTTRDFQRGHHRAELNCASCHGNVHVPAVALSGSETCLTCHKEAVTEVEASVHFGNGASPRCLDCHATHRVETADTETCLTCHGEQNFADEHLNGQDVAALLNFQQSIHAEAIACSDCHGGHRILSSDNVEARTNRNNIAATCSDCHSDVAEQFASSEHAGALKAGFEMAPTCTDCHGEHDIHQITDSEARVSRQHEVIVCLNCHLNSPEVQERMTRSEGFIAAYANSIHGRAAAEGNLEAAICSDCHGGHQAMKASNPESRVNKFNLSETCGTCHEDIQVAFEASIHGEALHKGIGDAPTCTNCHSEHAISDHTDNASPVSALNVSQEVCTPCHSSLRLSEKYGFPSDRSTSFGNSFHGLAGRFGQQNTANCTSCHGVHNILPSSDPRSQVNKANLEATCGNCHPGANINFTRGNVHIIRTADGDKILYWISTIYLIVIFVVIGLMALHNLLDWVRKLIERYHSRLAPPAPLASHPPRLFLRLSRTERVQHGLLALSFSMLVFTGFMLKFPDAWWVVALRSLVGSSLFDLRGILHRAAAIVMVGASLYHLFYLAFTVRGRQIVRDIWFSKSDLTQMRQGFLYNMGLSLDKPRFARFNYVEKSEYWALIWGTIVMSLTGFVLWFENHFMGEYSKLFVDINEVIHYYEAWLAFLSIVVWHLYYVIFNPDTYPMNLTWLTGRLTEEEMEHEHPLELERILEEEAKQEDEEEEDVHGTS